VDLVSEVRSVAPGTTFWVGVRQRIDPGWHTYWVNAGDSGEPMTIDWQLPSGVSAGPVAWPHPHRIPVGPAMSFGYTDEVVLPVPGAIDDRPTSRKSDVAGANNCVRAALQAVAAGRPVKTPVTRAYGCTVKYP
jgi:DsbC/DsbD-like thiol-disulfide interchange protein